MEGYQTTPDKNIDMHSTLNHTNEKLSRQTTLTFSRSKKPNCRQADKHTTGVNRRGIRSSILGWGGAWGRCLGEYVQWNSFVDCG